MDTGRLSFAGHLPAGGRQKRGDFLGGRFRGWPPGGNPRLMSFALPGQASLRGRERVEVRFCGKLMD